MNTLDVLYRTRATLMDEDQPFRFGNWSTCTCGHIYAAITQKKLDRVDGDYRELIEYLPVFEEIVDILQLEIPKTGNALTAVSNFTALLDGVDMLDTHDRHRASIVTRDSALTVVNEAIERLEKTHEQDRINVLQQMEEVVEQAEEKELILA